MNIAVSLWEKLSKRSRNRLVFVLFVMLASSLSEMLAVAVIFPYLKIVSRPELYLENQDDKILNGMLMARSANEVVAISTVLFCLAILGAAAIRLYNQWLNAKVAAEVGTQISVQGYANVMHQEYLYHIDHDSPSIVNTLLNSVNRTVIGISGILQLLTSASVAIGLLIGLFINDKYIGFAFMIFIGSIYSLITVYSKNTLRLGSYKVQEYSQDLIRIIQETTSSIKEVLLRHSQEAYIAQYSRLDESMRNIEARNSLISTFPRFSVEALGVVLLSFLALYLTSSDQNELEVIPLVGSFAFTAQRLLPAAQQIYSRWVSLKSYTADIYAVIDLISLCPTNDPVKSGAGIVNYSFERLELKGVEYSYSQKKDAFCLGEINLTISRGQKIGIIGSTGSGKSTLLDIILGLIVPDRGEVRLDGVELNASERVDLISKWHSIIGYVPQHISLHNSSIAENIAFDVDGDEIDISRIETAAKMSCISDFINTLSDGYGTIVGERGIRLSGGQRQRIGIARALYRQPRVLVMDEATSALDLDTEEQIMCVLQQDKLTETMIIATHRTRLLALCDEVYRVEHGRVVRIRDAL